MVRFDAFEPERALFPLMEASSKLMARVLALMLQSCGALGVIE